jgi:hypothetical protein
MMKAGCLYVVRYWIAPAAEEKVLAWIDGGHTRDVVNCPGFLWAQRVRLEEVDALGWRAFANIYGLESRAALDAYFKLPIGETFRREAAAFKEVLRSERMWGVPEAGLLEHR